MFHVIIVIFSNTSMIEKEWRQAFRIDISMILINYIVWHDQFEPLWHTATFLSSQAFQKVSFGYLTGLKN